MAQAAIPIVASIAGSLIGAGAGALMSKKVKPPAAPPIMTRDRAAEAVQRSDEFRRRRGAGANELTGGGAEASTGGGKTLLGQ